MPMFVHSLWVLSFSQNVAIPYPHLGAKVPLMDPWTTPVAPPLKPKGLARTKHFGADDVDAVTACIKFPSWVWPVLHRIDSLCKSEQRMLQHGVAWCRKLQVCLQTAIETWDSKI